MRYKQFFSNHAHQYIFVCVEQNKHNVHLHPFLISHRILFIIILFICVFNRYFNKFVIKINSMIYFVEMELLLLASCSKVIYLIEFQEKKNPLNWKSVSLTVKWLSFPDSHNFLIFISDKRKIVENFKEWQ